jgi:hypothetical protein
MFARLLRSKPSGRAARALAAVQPTTPVRHGRRLAGLSVSLERAPHRGAAFALTNASRRARTRSTSAHER